MMRDEDLIQHKGSRVKLVLTNGNFYDCTVIDVTESSVRIRDIRNKDVTINIDVVSEVITQ